MVSAFHQSATVLIDRDQGKWCLKPGRTSIYFENSVRTFDKAILPHDLFHYLQRKIWANYQLALPITYTDADEICADYWEEAFKHAQPCNDFQSLLIPRKYVVRSTWNLIDVSNLLLNFSAEQKGYVARQLGMQVEQVFPIYQGIFTRSLFYEDLKLLCTDQICSNRLSIVEEVFQQRGTTFKELVATARDSISTLRECIVKDAKVEGEYYLVPLKGTVLEIYTNFCNYTQAFAFDSYRINEKLDDQSTKELQRVLQVVKMLIIQLNGSVQINDRLYTEAVSLLTSIDQYLIYEWQIEG